MHTQLELFNKLGKYYHLRCIHGAGVSDVLYQLTLLEQCGMNQNPIVELISQLSNSAMTNIVGVPWTIWVCPFLTKSFLSCSKSDKGEWRKKRMWAGTSFSIPRRHVCNCAGGLKYENMGVSFLRSSSTIDTFVDLYRHVGCSPHILMLHMGTSFGTACSTKLTVCFTLSCGPTILLCSIAFSGLKPHCDSSFWNPKRILQANSHCIAIHLYIMLYKLYLAQWFYYNLILVNAYSRIGTSGVSTASSEKYVIFHNWHITVRLCLV